MGIGQGDNLPGVGGIGKNFLITSHRGVEHHLTDGGALSTNSLTGKTTAILKS
jgi:hypothetical protein